MPEKAQKIKRVLKSAARLRVPRGGLIRGSGRDAFSPVSGEVPVVLLRIQVLGCKDLLAKDKNGSSDPFVVVSILNTRHTTPVIKRTINPSYAAKDATFDFPLYLSLAEKLGVLEIVVWDKDMLKKDYLGEISLPLEQWFRGPSPSFAFEDPNNQPFSLNLDSTRAGTNAKGTVQIKLGFVAPPNARPPLEFKDIFHDFVRRSKPSLVSAPPTKGVGTVRSSHSHHPDAESGSISDSDLEDDGGISSDESDSEAEGEDYFEDASADTPTPATTPSTFSTLYTPPVIQAAGSPATPKAGASTPPSGMAFPATPVSGGLTPKALSSAVPLVNLTPASPMTEQQPPPPVVPLATTPSSAKSGSGFSIPRMKFPKRSLSSGIIPTISSSTSASEGVPPSPGTPGSEKSSRFRKNWGSGHRGGPSGSSEGSSGSGGSEQSSSSRIRRSKKKERGAYSFGGANDIVGIVMLEIKGAEDLPRLKNMTRTGWDMDPFVVISFGKKVFRTRVIRHSRNPVWDEKLLFHVRRYETSFKVQLTILDWDKLSSNDYIGDAALDVKELLARAPQPDPNTGLYPEDAEEGEAQVFNLPLRTAKEMPWESKHNPTITFKAKYQPYAALRQHFWRQYLKQYDSDDTRTLSHIEITSMLDSLGSTLTRSTISSFFTRFGKEHHNGELTIEEAVQCLETELGRPDSEKKRLNEDESLPDTSVVATPLLMMADSRGKELSLEGLDFSGPAMGVDTPSTPTFPTEPSQMPLGDAAAAYSSSEAEEEESAGSGSNAEPPASVDAPGKRSRFRRTKSKKKVPKAISAAAPSDSFERVINVKNCPLCHRPRLNSKAEMDIVTHLAVCASQDWNRVDKIVVGDFVTASQAQRKWYTKIIGKVSSGNYKLGANSANIIVQNRTTGQLEEEKMQVYVRLGIRLLYKGAKGRMEGARARRLLKSLSIKQGVKYDAPESAKDIPAFIAFHGLDVNEILDPLDSFKTFNQFFYRKLKSSARPVENPEDPYRLVSAADCRFMAFHSIQEATSIWIKGREFTVARLLGDAYKDDATRFVGGALCIFRLAPQDYHRFHSPVDGTIGKMTYISGEYYTVNPQAIRTRLDVYGENARKIVPIDSPQFGRVMAVCVGAMMVGSIETTVEEGQTIKRGDEFGFFAFGGSTIVVLFEKDRVEWDEDLLINGRAALETLVRVGTGIGRKPNTA